MHLFLLLGIREEIIEIFKNLAHEDGKCVIIVTHSANVCDQVDMVYDLKKVKNK